MNTGVLRALARRRGRLLTMPATIALAADGSEQESPPINDDPRQSPRFEALLVVPEMERRSPASAGIGGTKKARRHAAPFKGGASRTRTGDLLGAIQALSQLSYSPEPRLVPRRSWDSSLDGFSRSVLRFVVKGAPQAATIA
jgi:hypothetical protein